MDKTENRIVEEQRARFRVYAYKRFPTLVQVCAVSIGPNRATRRAMQSKKTRKNGERSVAWK